MSLRLKKRGEKALERALVVASPTDDEPTDGMKAKWTGQPQGETIEERDEPPPSAGLSPSPSPGNGMHRREKAEVGDDDDDDDD